MTLFLVREGVFFGMGLEFEFWKGGVGGSVG